MPARPANSPAFAEHEASRSRRNLSELPSRRLARPRACLTVQRTGAARSGDARGRERRERCAIECDLRLDWYGDGIALHTSRRPETARVRSHGKGRSRERNQNIYSLTYAGGEGRRAKIEMKSKSFLETGAVERTRTSTGCPASTSS